MTTTTTTASPETTPLANSPEARTPTGEIKDVNLPLETKSPPAEPKEGVDPPQKPAVPETYQFKAPEGFALDEKLVAEATPIFKELGLTQDAAQRLVDMYSKQAIALGKAGETAVAQMRSEQLALINKDPALGPRVDAVKADIGKMLNALDDKGQRLIPEPLMTQFKADMDLTGSGDFHSIVKVLSILASQFTEGTHVSGRGPSTHGQTNSGRQERPSPAAAMYPTLPHN